MKAKRLIILASFLMLFSCEGDHIDLSRTRLDFGYSGGTEVVTSDGIWGIDTAGELKEDNTIKQGVEIVDEEESNCIYLHDKWLSATIDRITSDVIITVKPNETSTSRSYRIRVWRGNVSKAIIITQKGKPKL